MRRFLAVAVSMAALLAFVASSASAAAPAKFTFFDSFTFQDPSTCPASRSRNTTRSGLEWTRATYRNGVTLHRPSLRNLESCIRG
jgi:hypothetical protein